VITVELTGRESAAGACPAPPGLRPPLLCPAQFVGRATFREHVGVGATIHGVVLAICHGEACELYRPDAKQANTFDIPPNAERSVAFWCLYSGVATSATVSANVTSKGTTYPVVASLQRLGG
jgi:hypothetical protein